MLLKRKKGGSDGIKFKENKIPMKKSNGVKFREGGYYDYVAQRKSSPRIVEISDRDEDRYQDEYEDEFAEKEESLDKE